MIVEPGYDPPCDVCKKRSISDFTSCSKCQGFLQVCETCCSKNVDTYDADGRLQRKIFCSKCIVEERDLRINEIINE